MMSVQLLPAAHAHSFILLHQVCNRIPIHGPHGFPSSNACVDQQAITEMCMPQHINCPGQQPGNVPVIQG